MTSDQALSPQDRKFFSQVVKAIFTNPFSDERDEILRSLFPGFHTGEANQKTHFKNIEPALNDRVHRLEKKGIKTVQDINSKDGDLLKYSFLLQAYLRYLQGLDQLIQTQVNMGAKSAEVLFAHQLISDLRSRGFSETQSRHYFSLFYQFRRAFHFIDDSLVGQSPSMKQLRESLWNNVFTQDVGIYDRHLVTRMEDFSTLLLGETGTGKGSAAAAIGRSGYIPFDPGRKRFVENFNETFISINLSQFPETLIESELFGHRKGSFTGAVDDHRGVFEKCSSHGALFLDEIGDVSFPVQIKLLQILQERTFTPVGSHTPKRFAGRVIAASNRSITDLRKKGEFRDDFFYRLCSDVITVPTLRQRIEEMPAELEKLVNLLVARMTGQESLELTDMILETFKRELPVGYSWPGNVRELEQAVRRVLLTRHYSGDFTANQAGREDVFLDKVQAGELDASELLGLYCALLYKRLGTYEAVARRTSLDRRTVKKYLEEQGL